MDTHEKLLEGGETADAVVPGNPAKSEILVRIHLRPIDEGVMPDEGQALKPEEVALLDAWVEAGAEWPEGVTLTERKPVALKRVALPKKAPGSATEAAAMLDDLLGAGWPPDLQRGGAPVGPAADPEMIEPADMVNVMMSRKNLVDRGEGDFKRREILWCTRSAIEQKFFNAGFNED